MNDLFEVARAFNEEPSLVLGWDFCYDSKFTVFDLDAPGDHLLIESEDEYAFGYIEKKLDGFQYLDGLFRQTAVQIVHENDKAAILGFIDTAPATIKDPVSRVEYLGFFKSQ